MSLSNVEVTLVTRGRTYVRIPPRTTMPVQELPDQVTAPQPKRPKRIKSSNQVSKQSELPELMTVIDMTAGGDAQVKEQKAVKVAVWNCPSCIQDFSQVRAFIEWASDTTLTPIFLYARFWPILVNVRWSCLVDMSSVKPASWAMSKENAPWHAQSAVRWCWSRKPSKSSLTSRLKLFLFRAYDLIVLAFEIFRALFTSWLIRFSISSWSHCYVLPILRVF